MGPGLTVPIGLKNLKAQRKPSIRCGDEICATDAWADSLAGPHLRVGEALPGAPVVRINRWAGRLVMVDAIDPLCA